MSVITSSRAAPTGVAHPTENRHERILAWLSEALDSVAGISQTLAGDWKLDRDPADVFMASLPALRGLADFRTMAYLSVDQEGLTFDLEVVEPDRSASLVRKELEHQVEEGTFAWSIYQNRAVVVPGAHLGPWIVLHPLATPARVMGMFIGSLSGESAFIPDAFQKVLSILLMNCASVMESGMLYRELNRYNQNLEAIITERTEELRRSEEAARQASRAKSEFLANMSHEIRTPINGIVGMNSLMLQGALSTEQHDQAQTIRRSADNLLTLINDILDFSKIEAGHLAIEHVPYDLKVAVEDVNELLGAKAAEKGVELVTRYRTATPRHVVGDPSRMRQILTNLVGNAIKFTDSGHVAVDVEWTPRAPSRGLMRVSVEDTGVGIDPTKLERIFEKFTQADSSTTRVYGGTGLGLSISRQLARLMGGELRADSVPGSGSTFFVELPVEVEHGHVPEVHVPDLSGRRVAVVARNRALCGALKEALDGLGAHTIVAPAPDALGSLMAGSVSDLAMAIVDNGYPPAELESFSKWVRASASDPALVLLSNMADRADSLRFIGTHYDDLLLKPVRERRLNAALAGIDRTAGPACMNAAAAADAVPSADTSVPGPLAPARVLLVEDEPVNRMVASQMLRRLGHEVDIAEHGAAAVERIEEAGFTHYDLVFMDCQTPVLDGFEATKQLRSHQHALKAPHLNIVALTASALAGDRERCLAAGMDDYLAKPIRIEDVQGMLEKWLPRARVRIVPDSVDAPEASSTAPADSVAAPLAPPAPTEAPTPGPLDFDEEAAMTQLAGDWNLFWTIATLFVEGWPDVEQRLDRALSECDTEALRQAAHFLKGGAANVGAAQIRALAGELEKQAATGVVDDAAGRVHGLRAAMQHYLDAIEAVRAAQDRA